LFVHFELTRDGGLYPSQVWRPRSLAILPAAVAHARPDGNVADFSPAGPRWFARAQLELLPAAGTKGWTAAERLRVSMLVVEHVWRDPAFVEVVARELSEEGG